MKITVFFCKCGDNISAKIDEKIVETELRREGLLSSFSVIEFACGEEGKDAMVKELSETRPDRVVVAACSPRDHEETFRKVMVRAGLNPYLLQMVNVREHIAWVTKDREQATNKAVVALRSAINRVRLHEPLEKTELEICPNVLVIGAGSAGMKAALTLAQAGRKVILVEKSPNIGGLAVRNEEVFPTMECAPCMLEPMMGEIIHGEHAANIELMTMSEVVSQVGFWGNYTVKIRRKPRYIDPKLCIGCGECVRPCPVRTANEFNGGMDQRAAVAFPFPGALPNLPFLDFSACVRSKGEACELCNAACPVPGAVNYQEVEEILERNVGAILVAVGAALYERSHLVNADWGPKEGLYTSDQFERLLSSSGPTEGKILTMAGIPPKKVAIIHCAGSLDACHKEYCSEVCCQYAFKFNHFLRHKVPGVQISHFVKTVSVPGKRGFSLYKEVRESRETTMVWYKQWSDLTIGNDGKTLFVEVGVPGAPVGRTEADMVILCPPVIPNDDSRVLAKLFELKRDRQGFLEELHDLTDSSRSRIKGIFVAGTCQSPMDIQHSMTQGLSAAGGILSELVEGRKIDISPIHAQVDAELCSGCRACLPVCPYKAISFLAEKKIAEINPVLCVGCGTCVSTCPSGCIKGIHFTRDEIIAEIDGVLK